jgi:hypothetical protein
MSSIVDRWLSQESQVSQRIEHETQTAAGAPETSKTAPLQKDSHGCTEVVREKETQRDRESNPAIPATVATPGTVLDIRSASRGPCIHCGEPVTWQDGLKNWFGELVHRRCAGRRKEQEQAPAGERQRVGTCPRCKFAVFSDNAIKTGGGVLLHPACARG